MEQISRVKTNVNYLSFNQDQDFYLRFFDLIKKLIPESNIDVIYNNFRKKYTPHQDFSNQLAIKAPVHENSAINKIRKIKLSRRVILYGGILIIFLMLCFYSIIKLEFTSMPQNTECCLIRSDLLIPSKTTLLQRPDLLNEIDKKLSKIQGIQVLALIGIGGAGKTTLVRQYARHQKHVITWEINAETKESVMNSFESLAYVLAQTDNDRKKLKNIEEIKQQTLREEKLIFFVKEFFRIHNNWLLIFDNVENINDIQNCLPQDHNIWGNGKVILISRDSNIMNNSYINSTIHIGELTQNEKLRLFTKIMQYESSQSINETNFQEINVFLNQLPPFPLDISIAAYYLKSTYITYKVY